MDEKGGKGDMDRIGLFQEMAYFTINDRYKQGCVSSMNQLLPGGSKTRSAIQSVYFTDKFGRVLEGEAYTDPIKIRRQHRLKEAQRNIGKTFLPSSGDKKMLLEVIGCKIYSIQLEDMSLEMLSSTGTTKSLRVEEVHKDEIQLADNETLIHVAHFHKEVFSTFGVPFLLKIKNNEKFSTVKEKIQKKLDIPEKKFEKYKFAVIVMGKVEYISDEDQDLKVNISQLLPHSLSGSGNIQARPWLGLDHINKMPKRGEIHQDTQLNLSLTVSWSHISIVRMDR